MLRSVILCGALLAAPAFASSHYHAQPEVRPEAAKLVVRDTIWSCGDGGCAAAGKSGSRPAIICEVLVKQVGALRSFTVAGKAISPEQLEKCNARAH